jgi:hypothetical protein
MQAPDHVMCKPLSRVYTCAGRKLGWYYSFSELRIGKCAEPNDADYYIQLPPCRRTVCMRRVGG